MSFSFNPNTCILMFYFQTFVFLLSCFLEPWCCCSEWQMWRTSPPGRSWWKLKKKGPKAPLPYLLFTVPITLFPWVSWGNRPVLSGLLLTANFGSHVWIGQPSQGLLIGQLLQNPAVGVIILKSLLNGTASTECCVSVEVDTVGVDHLKKRKHKEICGCVST